MPGTIYVYHEASWYTFQLRSWFRTCVRKILNEIKIIKLNTLHTENIVYSLLERAYIKYLHCLYWKWKHSSKRHTNSHIKQVSTYWNPTLHDIDGITSSHPQPRVSYKSIVKEVWACSISRYLSLYIGIIINKLFFHQ